MEENDEDVKGDILKLSTPLAKRRLSIAMTKDVHISYVWLSQIISPIDPYTYINSSMQATTDNDLDAMPTEEQAAT